MSTLKRAMAEILGNEGYAVPNRFDVLILHPPKLKYYINGINPSVVSLRCESIDLPGRSLNAAEDTNIYGPSRNIVTGVTYAGEISMVFQASADLKERIFFEEWQKLAFGEEVWNVGYYNDYVSAVEIYVLDRADVRRYGIKLHEAYPKEIAATTLDQGANSEIIKNTINFQYRYWTKIDPDAGMSYQDTLDSQIRTMEQNTPSSKIKLGRGGLL
jgi:hypothetical protein